MKIRSALNIGAITRFLEPLAMSLSDAIRLKNYPQPWTPHKRAKTSWDGKRKSD